MIQTINKAALYARYSSDNQRSESIDAQLRAMQNYCQQNHILIVETYIDEAKSATTDHRPSFQKMIADSKYHQFNIILVHKLDRFARNRYDSAVYKRELKKNGVSVYSVLENLDDSPESIMMESVLEGMSEYYSQNLAREVMKGMRETALQCKHTGGKPPLGYEIDQQSKKLTVNEQEAEIVRSIFSMYAQGNGYSQILHYLHQKGYKTKRGQEFQKNSLYSILTNKKYQGIYVFNQSSSKSISGSRNTHLHKNSDDIICIEGGCPQIVDSVTFQKVQQRIKEHRHHGGRENAKTNYLLSGKVYCMDCGRAMVGNTRYSGRNKQRYVTYRCPSKRYACSNKEIYQEYLETYLIHLLENRIFNRASLKQISDRIKGKEEEGREKQEDRTDLIAEKLRKIDEAIQNITDAVIQGLYSPALGERLSALEQEKVSLEAEKTKMSSMEQEKIPQIDPELILQEYAQAKKATSSPEYKQMIQEFIDKIVVGKYCVEITLKTGMDIFPSLDTSVQIKRQEIYEKKGEVS